MSLVRVKNRVPGLSEASLAKFLVRAKRAAGLREKVGLLITGNREMQRLNRQFRSQDKPTDVLSFPAADGARNGLAGDIAVSAEIAAGNARRLGHEAADEVRILVLHGVLHLAGFDHESDQGQMARKEQHLRKALGLPAGLIERVERPRSARRLR